MSKLTAHGHMGGNRVTVMGTWNPVSAEVAR